MRAFVAAGIAALAMGVGTARAADMECNHNRECLAEVMNAYLQALIKHDPASLPVTRNIKYTENGVRLEASFQEFLEIYEAKKPCRTESYHERVMRALLAMPFAGLPTTEEIEAYRDARLTAGLKPSTVRQDLAATIV